MAEASGPPHLLAASMCGVGPAVDAASGLDLDAWRGDLHRLHGTIDQVVQSFIGSQARQLEAVAAELASQKERIMVKEMRFAELSDSIASFVESEAKRMEACGLSLCDPEADARHEAYDADLPGPQALHRINRLWRKATRAFEVARQANEKESAAALEAQRRELEARVAEADQRCDKLRQEHEAQLHEAQSRLEATTGVGEQKSAEVETLCAQVASLTQQMDALKGEVGQKAAELEQATLARNRSEYQWEAERDDLAAKHNLAANRIQELERAVQEAKARERELSRTCDDQTGKLEQMRRTMDDQERELNQKIERVQHYVKERQAGAMHAEKKQQDAERLAERWQGEVRRLQTERDRLAKTVHDLEGNRNGQVTELHAALEKNKQEVASLREALRKKDEDAKSSSLELLQQRDEEFQAKVNLEKQREKDRSIALLRKKEQEVVIKDQQLKAARQRIQELESSAHAGSGGTASGYCTAAGTMTSLPPTSMSPVGSTRSGSAGGRRDMSLPPLPLTAR